MALRSMPLPEKRGGTMLTTEGAHGEAEIKVLVELFQKLAGFQRAAPFGRTPQRAPLSELQRNSLGNATS